MLKIEGVMPRPCAECPFRIEARGRTTARHARAILQAQGPWPCHKTVAFDGRFNWRRRAGEPARACRGAARLRKNEPAHALVLQHHGIDPATLRDDTALHPSPAAFVAAQIGA